MLVGARAYIKQRGRPAWAAMIRMADYFFVVAAFFFEP